MGKVLIIGAGGVGAVVTHKCARIPDVFTEIVLASRTLEKCELIKSQLQRPIEVARLDADNVDETVALIEKVRPDLVVNVALPYQDLPIMDACLATGVNYMDTANYEPRDKAEYAYGWQWAYHDRFREKGIMALLGCGFDPGVTGVWTAWAAKHHFDAIHTLDIMDCNAGSHGHSFATNFNAEVNIREVSAKGKYYEEGRWIETEPQEIHKSFDFPEIGPREMYLMYHEELESLVKFFPTLRHARFWMTFSEQYITHLRVLENVGMTRVDPVDFQGCRIIPLQFLQALLPVPSSLGENYTGKINIGCWYEGIREGKPRKYYIYCVMDHEEAWRDVRAQAIAYSTGIPAMLGAMMMLQGKWTGRGVFNVEQMDPDPFMEQMRIHAPYVETFPQ